jgi:hypothetical protein
MNLEMNLITFIELSFSFSLLILYAYSSCDVTNSVSSFHLFDARCL